MDYLTRQYLRLGASLYVPAVHKSVRSIAEGDRLEHARSVIFCTEDSIRDEEVPQALRNLQETAKGICKSDSRMLFVRPRNAAVLQQLLALKDIDNFSGFVLPKVTEASMAEYLEAFNATGRKVEDFFLMPTLETVEAFDVNAMTRLRSMMLDPGVRQSILALRIGGNDLMNLLGVRRSRHRTLYESPMQATITSLVTTFRPYGFNLASPVCELLSDQELLEREVALDMEYGLFAKTAIHPDQIALIEAAYAPSEKDVKIAEAILAPDAPAVFGMGGAMCEVATHRNWAEQVRARAEVYGIYGKHASLTLIE